MKEFASRAVELIVTLSIYFSACALIYFGLKVTGIYSFLVVLVNDNPGFGLVAFGISAAIALLLSKFISDMTNKIWKSGDD